VDGEQRAGAKEDPPAAPAEAAAPREVPDRAAAGVSERLDRIERLLAEGLAGPLCELRDQLALDHFREQQIDRLHQELQGYKTDLLRRAVRPLLLGLIRLHDNLGKVQGSLRQVPPAELTAERIACFLDGFRGDLELLLEEHEVLRFETAGERFDPHRQTVARTVPAADPGLAGQVAERLRPGFALGEVPLQKERVAVYVAAAGDAIG
jgi:molecular chaperone GrpE